MKKLMIGVIVSAAASGFAADTWYVNAANAGKALLDGRSEETAFATIQEAVNCTRDNDTVWVAEGVYDSSAPTCAPGAMAACVSITNKITVRASGAKSKTVIVGKWASTSSGIGEDSVRCVYIADSVKGAVIRGFTIRDGGVKETALGATGSGGGVYAGSHYSLGNLIIDCDIFHCVGSRGGAVKGGTSVRCRFVANSCNYTGAVGRDAAFWNCLVVSNGQKPSLFEGGRLVNCTVIGNSSSAFASSTYALNTICLGNDTSNGRADMKSCKGSIIGLPNALGATEANGLENAVYDSTAQGAVIAPLLGDFRVVKGHSAETSGRISYMSEAGIHSYIPEAERYIDLNGNAIVEKDGKICAGALQETAVRAATGGGIVGAGVGKWCVLGYPTTMDTLWAFPSEYPAYIKIDAFKDTNIVAFAYSSSFNDYRQGLLDGTIYVLPPVGRDALQAITPIFADVVIYVNPDSSIGSDTAGDGSSKAPYETISKAVSAAPDSKIVKIACAAGTYAKDGDLTECHSHRARVYIPSGKNIFLKGAGVGKSIIQGVAVSDGVWGGCGAGAAKCLAIDGSMCGVQGFTLRDGFSYGGSENVAKDQGGAIRAHISSTTENVIVSDVLITNCGARSGGAAFGGNYERCEVTLCVAPYSLFRNAGFVTSCYVHSNTTSEYGAFIYEYPVYDSTVIITPNAAIPFSDGQACFNSICDGGTKLAKPLDTDVGFPGCVFYNFTSYYGTPESAHYTQADPQFVVANTAGDGDGRLKATSPAFGTAGVALVEEESWLTNYHRYATTDLKGFPRAFVNGKTVPGAFTWPVAKVAVSTPLVGGTTQSGEHYLYRDEALTFTYTPDADAAKARNFLGYATNGVIVSSASTYTLTGVEAGGTYDVEGVVSTNWYVNANALDDTGDGFTPETAKKTLRAIMEDVYILAGDCVHAAEGDYSEGTMFPQNGTYGDTLGLTTNRVVINEGVSLVADGARDKTIIRGIKGKVSAGCGPGALRCAFMYPNTLLKGFTLADGATATHASPAGAGNDDYSGGGVLTKGVDAKAYVENCVFTNCSARNGGGAFGGYMVNCLFTDCKAANTGSALRNCWRLFGCIIANNGTLDGPYGIDSCTFGPNTSLTYGSSTITSYTIKNSLMLGKVNYSTSRKFSVSNCLFADTSGVAEGVAAECIKLDKDLSDVVFAADKLAIDDNFMPVKSSVAVNGGVNDKIPAELHGVDALGHQRIWDGTVDIGAVEYDWRGDYAAALGNARLTVTEASSEVRLVDGKVCLADGAELVAVWRDIQPESARMFTASVQGSGTLGVEVNEDVEMAITAANGGAKRYSSEGTADTLDFSYAGDGFAELSTFRGNFGLVISIR